MGVAGTIPDLFKGGMVKVGDKVILVEDRAGFPSRYLGKALKVTSIFNVMDSSGLVLFTKSSLFLPVSENREEDWE